MANGEGYLGWYKSPHFKVTGFPHALWMNRYYGIQFSKVIPAQNQYVAPSSPHETAYQETDEPMPTYEMEGDDEEELEREARRERETSRGSRRRSKGKARELAPTASSNGNREAGEEEEEAGASFLDEDFNLDDTPLLITRKNTRGKSPGSSSKQPEHEEVQHAEEEEGEEATLSTKESYEAILNDEGDLAKGVRNQDELNGFEEMMLEEGFEEIDEVNEGEGEGEERGENSEQEEEAEEEEGEDFLIDDGLSPYEFTKRTKICWICATKEAIHMHAVCSILLVCDDCLDEGLRRWKHKSKEGLLACPACYGDMENFSPKSKLQ